MELPWIDVELVLEKGFPRNFSIVAAVNAGDKYYKTEYDGGI